MSRPGPAAGCRRLARPSRRPSCGHRRRAAPAWFPRRSLHVSVPPVGADFDFAKIKDELLGRRPKFVYDYLSPTSSHLLNAALSDHVPPAHQPPSYRREPVVPSQLGAPLPQGHHLVYFPFQLPASRLASDGADLDHAPGAPFLRRMWAGGSIRFGDQVKLDGGPAVCLETVEDVTLKDGDVPGKEKIFVDTWRRYLAGGPSKRPTAAEVKQSAQIEERRTLVFMRTEPGKSIEAKAAAPRSRLAGRKPDVSFSLVPDPFLLFHYSALLYNAHFIHYERQWTQGHEGYKDLIVHGPLSLTLMLAVLLPLLAAQESSDRRESRQAVVRNLE